MEEKKFRNKVGWFQFLCCAMVIRPRQKRWSYFRPKGRTTGRQPPGVRPFSGVMESVSPAFHDSGPSFLPVRFYLGPVNRKWKTAGADT